MTNGDRFRTATDDELAELMAKFAMNVQRMVRSKTILRSQEWTQERLLEWLRREGEE